MTYYMLCQVVKNAEGRQGGDEVWLGTFDSTEKLLEAIPERSVSLKVVGNTVTVDSEALVQSLSKYRIKAFEMNSLRQESPEIDLPSISLTVQSLSDPGKFYGIAITDGELRACSCPSFIYQQGPEGLFCKHMKSVTRTPETYGLRAEVLGGEVVYRLASTYSSPSFQSFPGAFFMHRGK